MATPETRTATPDGKRLVLCLALAAVGVVLIFTLGMPGLVGGVALICAAVVLFVRGRR